MKYIITLVLLLPCLAQAGNFVLGTGLSHFDKAPDGIWYQGTLPHEVTLKSQSGTIRYDFDSDWSLGYIYTGKVRATSTIKADEIAYWASQPYPLSHLSGEGKSEGVFATWRTDGTAYLTYGAMLYRSTWDAVIPDHYNSATGGTFKATYHHKPNWRVMPTFGVGYRWKQNSVELNAIPTRCFGDQYPAIFDGYAVNFSVLHRF